MFVDSHCHIPILAAETGDSTSAIVQRAHDNRVSHMLCVCVDMESWPGVMDVATQHPGVSASVGVHPNTTLDQHEPTVAELVRATEHSGVVAIGETGLDYFRSSGDLEWQRDRFRTHIRAAREAGKPLIVHSREARADVISVLREERASEVGGVMHCFVDDLDTALAAIDMGFLISFSGIVTFRSATALQAVARELPLSSLLIETDSPWLAPVPHRGKKNEPAWVVHVAEFLAGLRNESVDEIAQATSANFYRLFNPVPA